MRDPERDSFIAPAEGAAPDRPGGLRQAAASGPLLGREDPPPIERIVPCGDRALVLVCDHAGRAVPRALGDLGLSRAALDDHIGWDIGAGAVTRALAARFGVAAVLGGYSRLVIDLNRNLADPSAFARVSDGVLIPGNLGMNEAMRAARIDALFRPYHDAVRAAIDLHIAGERRPVLVSIHSFTPRQHGIARPWQVGVLWDRDPRLALPLMCALRAGGDIVVGDNEPYSGRHPADFTIDHHAEPLGLAHASIEIRQDLIADKHGQQRWAARIGDALEAALADDRLYVELQRRGIAGVSR
jgi:predicted N-formylglutamate amidohydrolase